MIAEGYARQESNTGSDALLRTAVCCMFTYLLPALALTGYYRPCESSTNTAAVPFPTDGTNQLAAVSSAGLVPPAPLASRGSTAGLLHAAGSYSRDAQPTAEPSLPG